MKNLSNLIKGLQIIAKVEGEETSEFNSQNSLLFIGVPVKYSDEDVRILHNLGFEINTEYECFEYDLD